MLLHGVTGSGKTEVYLAAADARARARRAGADAGARDQPDAAARSSACAPRFPACASVTLHSGLAAGERRAHWRAAASGARASSCSARGSPCSRRCRGSALVVVDEEHDASYKQQDGVRYHGARPRRLARAASAACRSCSAARRRRSRRWSHAQRGRYRALALAARADVRARAARRSASRRHRAPAAHDGIGARAARRACAARLDRGEQSLVFINRRGYAPSLMCAACGWESGCPRCSARLVVHRAAAGSLRCHHCGHASALPRACPECGNVDLLPLGRGTQRLEQCARGAFPGARIARVDRDSTRAQGRVRRRAPTQVDAGEVDILVGTQMLAKGHDFPRLTLVGVLGADNALYSADFRATERLAALLMQVPAARAARSSPGEVIVQTDFPGPSGLSRRSRRTTTAAFADELLGERRAAQLPPFAHVALLVAEAHARATTSIASSTARVAARIERCATAHAASKCSRRCRRRSRGARASSAARCSCKARGARRCSAFLPRWRDALAATARARACAGRSTSIRRRSELRRPL